MTIYNQGATSDIFTFEFQDVEPGWTYEVYAIRNGLVDGAETYEDDPVTSTGFLWPFDCLQLEVLVSAPFGERPGVFDDASLVATSVKDPAVGASSAMKTTVGKPGYALAEGEGNAGKNGDLITIYVVDTLTRSMSNLGFNTIPYGHWPWRGALRPDGKRLYATLKDYGGMVAIDTVLHQIIGPIPVGSQPDGVEFTPDSRYALVCNEYGGGVTKVGAESENGGTVTVIDSDASTVVATVSVGSRPRSVDVAPRGPHVAYITNHGDDSVTVIDTDDLTSPETRTITEGFDGPWGVVFSPDGRYAYVTNQEEPSYPKPPVLAPESAPTECGTVSKIDTQLETVVARNDIHGGRLAGLDITPDGKRLYVADVGYGGCLEGDEGAGDDQDPDDSASGKVRVVDAKTLDLLKIIPVPGKAREVTISANGKYAWVALMRSGKLAVIRTEDDTVERVLTVFGGCADILLDRPPRRLAVASQYGSPSPPPAITISRSGHSSTPRSTAPLSRSTVRAASWTFGPSNMKPSR